MKKLCQRQTDKEACERGVQWNQIQFKEVSINLFNTQL